MTLDMYTRAMMARFAISEGQRHGGVNNMIAVLHVLRNRVMAGWGDWQEVVDTAEVRRGTIYPPTLPNVRTNDVAWCSIASTRSTPGLTGMTCSAELSFTSTIIFR